MISFKRYGAARLLKLAKILDEADALHKANNEPGYNQQAMLHSCGTPACAMGHWAAANPKRFELRSVSQRILYKSSPFQHEADIAVAEFGITREEGMSIFAWHGCGGAKTAKQAAKVIRAFVKAKRKAEAAK